VVVLGCKNMEYRFIDTSKIIKKYIDDN